MNKINASLRLGLSSNSISVLHSSGWLRQRQMVVADQPLDGSSPLHMLTDLDRALTASGYSGLPTSVVLADQWTRLFMVTPPVNASCLSDCKAVAAHRFHLLYGDDAAQWLIEGDWNAEQTFLACAIQRSLLAVLQKAAIKHSLTLIRIAPQFVYGWNQRRRTPRDAWFGTLHGNDMTLGAICESRLVAIRRLSLTAAQRSDPHSVVAEINRGALKLSLPEPTVIELCGAVPKEWRNRAHNRAAFIPVEHTVGSPSVIPHTIAADLACTGRAT